MQFAVNGRTQSIIKVIGVGGGGSNAVTTMFRRGIRGVDFFVCNTDMQALERNTVPNKVRLGTALTGGLGCGAKPEIGRASALESEAEVRKILADGAKMVFITAGMGGGTGTGAAPVIAGIARELGLLTVGIVTTPFAFEGEWRSRIAQEGLRELETQVDSLLVINNENLMAICPKNIKQKDAYLLADKVLGDAAKGIAEIITVEGYVNVDFNDVETIMRGAGTAIMGSATFSGENRAQLAVEEALNSPLLDHVDIRGATGILLNITASEDSLTLEETKVIGSYVQQAAGNDARLIYGQVLNDDMGDDLTVTVIATGFKRQHRGEPAQSRTLNEVPRGSGKAVQGALPLDGGNRLGMSRPMQDPYTSGYRQAPPVAPYASPNYAQANEPGTIETRAARVEGREFDYHDPHKLRALEDEPAYLRRRIALDQDAAYSRPALSRTSVRQESSGRYQLRENNSYLFDNVD
jgi:cell division protein FtsZ